MGAVNKGEYTFHEMKVNIGGRFVRMSGLKFNVNQETEFIMTNSEDPQAIQVLMRKPEGTLKLVQSEYQALLNDAKGEDKLAHNAYDIVVVYKPKNQVLPILTKVLCHCVFVPSEEGMDEGDANQVLELAFKFLKIKTV